MVINLIVVAVTCLVLGLVGLWAFKPGLRPWIEAPKYRVLEWEELFAEAEREE